MTCNREDGDFFRSSGEVADESNLGSTRISRVELGSFQASVRSRRSLRSKHSRGYSLKKPLSSLESCLVAQLYKEHVEMEEYMFSSQSSPTTGNVRPLLVTDGHQIISKASSDSYSVQFENGESKSNRVSGLCEKEIAFGVPPLPVCGLDDKNVRQKKGTGRCGRLSSSKAKTSGKKIMAEGSADKMFLFCLGISIGVMSTIITTQKEVGKLNELLKQTENLVQDLQEELEMKDSLTVKELANEDYESQGTNDYSFRNRVLTSFSSEQEFELLHHNSRSLDHMKPVENSDSMSKIEAELEAELERLELNMNASNLETRLSDFVELDPDSVGTIIQGRELRVDMVDRDVGFISDSDASGTSSTQTQNMNTAVSPRELSLRLHEVVQARLEERIIELESELQNSHKKMNLMESKQRSIQRDLSNSEIGSSQRDSPTIIEGDTITRPLFLNLSGDALDAYNEAYDEFMLLSGTDEESTPIAKLRLASLDQNPFLYHNGDEENGSPAGFNNITEDTESSELNLTLKRPLGSQESNIVCSFEDDMEKEYEDDDDDDEMGKLLIKQIVEKARQGSPVVLNAQRVLHSMDEKL